MIPHQTTLRNSSGDGRRLLLECKVEPQVRVTHEIVAATDSVDFRLTLSNLSQEPADIEWAQPCIRVGRFTELGQEEYIRRCFIFTDSGLKTLDRTERSEEALYHGGQVYVPGNVDRQDVNPRPLSPENLANGLIGCFSADGSMLLAMAWDRTQELFQGVITCIHSDFRIGGLGPGETKKISGRIYLMENNPKTLLARYRLDFPSGSFGVE